MIVAYLDGNTRPLAQAAKAAGAAVRFRNPYIPADIVGEAHGVFCPGFDGIAASYAAAGIPRLDSLPIGDQRPEETSIDTLHGLPCLLICAPGPHLLASLAAAGIDPAAPGMPTIAVNAAAGFVHATHWLALDGQDRIKSPPLGKPLWLIADNAKHLPLGPFHRLSSTMGPISAGPYTGPTALRLAAILKPARLLIAGMDLIPGPGIDGSTAARDGTRFASERPAFEAALAECAAAGIEAQRLHPAPAAPAVAHPITAVRGIGKQTAATLQAAGIDTLEDLRAAAANAEHRQRLISLRGITETTLSQWVAQP